MNVQSWDRKSLNQAINSLRSCLCVGLDTDAGKIPVSFPGGPSVIFRFNKSIVDATCDLAVAYKINSAFYEVLGQEGWEAMKQTIAYVKSKNRFAILDAKRGDIGNTGELYARACFETLNADAATVSPYMGKDSVVPFLNYTGRWTVLLALTSNPGGLDFQTKRLDSGNLLFEEVILKSKQWADADQLMYVVGATKMDYIDKIRAIVPNYFLLIPGVGAQGGDLDQIMDQALTGQGDILVNVSRNILYASPDADYLDAARQEAVRLKEKMAGHLVKKLN